MVVTELLRISDDRDSLQLSDLPLGFVLNIFVHS